MSEERRRALIAYSLFDGIEETRIRYVLAILQDKDADPNYLLEERGIAAIHMAIGHESKSFAWEVTSILLQYGANPNIRSVEGMTPVHIASAWGRTRLLRLLLLNGGNPWLEDDEGQNAFHFAFEGGHSAAMQLLEDFRLKDSGKFDDWVELCDPNPKFTIALDKVLLYNREVLLSYQASTPFAARSRSTVATQTSPPPPVAPRPASPPPRSGPVAASTTALERFSFVLSDIRNKVVSQVTLRKVGKRAVLRRPCAPSTPRPLSFLDELRQRQAAGLRHAATQMSPPQRLETRVVRDELMVRVSPSPAPSGDESRDSDEFESHLDRAFRHLEVDAAFTGQEVHSSNEWEESSTDGAGPTALVLNLSCLHGLDRNPASCREDPRNGNQSIHGTSHGNHSVTANGFDNGTQQISSATRDNIPYGRHDSLFGVCNTSFGMHYVTANTSSNCTFPAINVDGVNGTNNEMHDNIPTVVIDTSLEAQDEGQGAKHALFRVGDSGYEGRSAWFGGRDRLAPDLQDGVPLADSSGDMYEGTSYDLAAQCDASFDDGAMPTPTSPGTASLLMATARSQISASADQDSAVGPCVVDASTVEDSAVGPCVVDASAVETRAVGASTAETSADQDGTVDASKVQGSAVGPCVVDASTVEDSAVGASTAETSADQDGTVDASKVQGSAVGPCVVDASAVETRAVQASTGQDGAVEASAPDPGPCAAEPASENSQVGVSADECSVVWVSAMDASQSFCSCRDSVLPTADGSVHFVTRQRQGVVSHSFALLPGQASTEFISEDEECFNSDCNGIAVAELGRSESGGAVHDGEGPAGERMARTPTAAPSTEWSDSFVSASEEYLYTDEEEGVVLTERRLLVPRPDGSDESTDRSLGPELDGYDTDTLRADLRRLGVKPGPILPSTKRVYLKKLQRAARGNIDPGLTQTYSFELDRSLRDETWSQDLAQYEALEQEMSQPFASADPRKCWREGVLKSSFCYLLLDPRITANLPQRAASTPPSEAWATFLEAVFYVGKGKRSRPYSHLYQAVGVWNAGGHAPDNKTQRILDIWAAGLGVVCLHVFQNVIPVEAYTREAAMLDALTLARVQNARRSEYYGVVATWPARRRNMLGTLLLHKALRIFLSEGERQLRPDSHFSNSHPLLEVPEEQEVGRGTRTSRSADDGHVLH